MPTKTESEVQKMEDTKKIFANKVLCIAIKYAEIIDDKLTKEENHSGYELEEINDGIRILSHLSGMIQKQDI